MILRKLVSGLVTDSSAGKEGKHVELEVWIWREYARNDIDGDLPSMTNPAPIQILWFFRLEL